MVEGQGQDDAPLTDIILLQTPCLVHFTLAIPTGIGRISDGMLCRRFTSVDLVEPLG